MTGQDFLKFDLPDAPGVYFFKDLQGNILYIGRATSLRDRVRSYFGDDLIHTRGPLLIDMVTQSARVDWQETGSVLEAIILENNLIREHLPRFNTKEKDNRSFNYIVITDEEFPRVLMVRGRNLEKDSERGDLDYKIRHVFGPYPQPTTLREALKIIRKIFPFRDKCEPKSEGGEGRPCFNRQIGLCPGVCSDEISSDEYMKIVRKIEMFLSGKTTLLQETLMKEMKQYAKEEQFEKAGETKRTLYALSHIQDIALIKVEVGKSAHGEDGFRVEAFDVAHMSGKDVAGVMTVVRNGMVDKAEYRKFKIKAKVGKSGNDDVNNLKEILTRRLGRTEWGMPDLIVVDGGVGQKNAGEEILQKFGLNIPVVSVVKDDAHKAREILGDDSFTKKYEQEILLANSEAHRFGITYHKLLRKKAFLKRVL